MLLKRVIIRDFMNDLLEASESFFINKCDEINLHKITDISDVREKIKISDFYGIEYSLINDYLQSYKGLNQYQIYNEVKKCISKIRVGQIRNIYGNDTIINCDIEMKVSINNGTILSNLFCNLFENKKVKYNIAVQFSLDDTIRNFKIIAVSNNQKEIKPQNAKLYDCDLVPTIFNFDDEAFDYNFSIPINIGNILREYGLAIDDTKKMRTDGRLEGNVIFIDKDLMKTKGLGSFRFTILHEFIHYDKHKYYMALKRILNDKYTNIKVEEQANGIAARLLVPTNDLIYKMQEYYETNDFLFCANKKRVLYQIINKLSSNYECSKELLKNRIDDSKILTYGIMLDNSTYITNEEYEELYKSDKNFRDKVDSKEIIKIDNQCYLNGVLLKYRNVYDSNWYCSSNFERCHLTKKIYNDVKNNNEINKYINFDKFAEIMKEDTYDDLMRDQVGSTIKKIREHKKMGLLTLENMSTVSHHTIIKIENNENVKNKVMIIAKICKGMNVPINVTKRILAKVKPNFNEEWNDKLLEMIIDEFYYTDKFMDAVNSISKMVECIEN